MKSLPWVEVFVSVLGTREFFLVACETETFGLTMALRTDGLLGIVASKDLFQKGKVVSTFSEGGVVGFFRKNRTNYLVQVHVLESPQFEGV